MLTVLCALFDGGVHVPQASRCFTPIWVDKLYRGVRRNFSGTLNFKCLTHYEPSVFEEPVQVVPFLDDNRKWTCLMECFRPDVVGDRNMLLGLDTIIQGSIDEIASDQSRIALCSADHAPVCAYNNAVMLYSREAAGWLWDEWTSDRERWEHDHTILGKPSELAFIDMMLKRPGMKPTVLEARYPGQVVCYRGWKATQVARARMVWFFGKPKCQDVTEPGLRQAWI